MEGMVCVLEAYVQGFFHLIGVHHPLELLRLVKYQLHLFLHFIPQVQFDEFRNFLAIDAMAITDRKEVGPSVLSQMRHRQETVLIHFVGIVRRETSLGGKGKLGYTVVNLLSMLLMAVGVHFLLDGSPHLLDSLVLLALLRFESLLGSSH
mmetsp:Transcript_7753/g.7213  ORF Transcript_7753/g.7213 Transcript_7753/m.7213 type:complete len:150 (-) Transcript_7753:136-585(-)